MRQVYSDPFGSYIGGFDKGLTRQMEVEQQIRANRNNDFNFNNMVPLEFQHAQRQNAFEIYGEQARRNALDYADQTGRRNNTAGEMSFQRDNVAIPFGDNSGYTNAMLNYTGNTMQPTGNAGEYNFLNPQGQVVSTMAHPGASLQGYFALPQARIDAREQFAQDAIMRESQVSNRNLEASDWYRNYQIFQTQQAAMNAQHAQRIANGAGAFGAYFGDNYGLPASTASAPPVAPMQSQLPAPFYSYPHPQTQAQTQAPANGYPTMPAAGIGGSVHPSPFNLQP
jgi:hypothetical protein